jgi:hypothetical protein
MNICEMGRPAEKVVNNSRILFRSSEQIVINNATFQCSFECGEVSLEGCRTFLSDVAKCLGGNKISHPRPVGIMRRYFL